MSRHHDSLAFAVASIRRLVASDGQACVRTRNDVDAGGMTVGAAASSQGASAVAWRRVRALLAGAICLLGVLGWSSSRGEEMPLGGEAPAKLATPIAVKSDAGTDVMIESRLKQLFESLDGLQSIVVSVNAGVVTLSGEVAAKAAHRQAVTLARRVHDVVEVRDHIVQSRDLWQRLIQTRDRVLAQLFVFIAYLPFLIVALAVLLVAKWLARGLAGSERIMRRFSRNPFMRDLARQFVRIAVIGAGLLVALEVLDASTLVGSLLGAAGVAGLAVGFALRDTVENYIASLLLSLRQPFARDDLVSIDGWEGRVVRLTARATILMTLDGNHTRIPNATVYKAVIVNYTRNPKRRFQFDVGVDTEQNLAAAQELAATTLGKMQGVLDDPPPVCTVEQLGDSNVLLSVFGWVDQSAVEFLKVRSEAIRLVKAAFDRAGIIMPEPIYNLRFGDLPTSLTGAARLNNLQVDARRAGTVLQKSTEPQQVIDIAPRDALDDQIAAERSSDAEDLLHPQAPRE